MPHDSYSCVVCQGDIRTPWDGVLAASDEVPACSNCEHHICWDCKETDMSGEDWCATCIDDAKNNNLIAV